MLKIQLLFVVAFFTITIVSAQEKTLVILHTNDLHSKLTGFAPESEYSPLVTDNDKTLGGFSRIASLIESEKEKNQGSVLVLDAGDFTMGSFFHVLEPDTGLQLQLMGIMGYDVVAIGNHEFDNGPEAIAAIINKARAQSAIPQLSIANIKFSDKDSGDDALAKLYQEGVIAPYTIVERAGLRIGVFAILGYDAREVSLKTFPVKITDPIKTANNTAKYLKKTEGVDLVICLSHSGVTPGKNGEWEGEDVKLANKSKFIDVIISGHTHTMLNEAIWVNDIPIVQTGSYGLNVGRLELNLKDGNITHAKYHLIQVNDEILGDAEIHQRIEAQKDLLDNAFLKDLKIKYDEPIAEASFEMICDEYDPENSTLGPLIADAIYNYVNNNTEEGTDIALIATGLIRDRIKTGDSGLQTASDIFRILSLGMGKDNIPGYPITRVYITPIELKRVIEILLAISPSNTAAYCYYSGISVKIDRNKGFMKKVQSIEIDGEEINLSKRNDELISLSASIYMMESIGVIKKMTYGIIKVEPKDEYGNIIEDFNTSIIDFNSNISGIQEGKEWLALIELLKSFDDINGNGIPDIPEYYSQPHIVLKNINN
jgi:5'-nucleotidase